MIETAEGLHETLVLVGCTTRVTVTVNPVLVLPPLKSPEVDAEPVMRALPALVELNATIQVAVPMVVPADNRHGLPVNEAPKAMPV